MKRLLFVTDLHGSSLAFRKLLNATKSYDVQALICGGDLVGKQTYPLVEADDGSLRLATNHGEQRFTDESEAAKAMKGIEDAGGYVIRMSAHEAARLAEDEEARHHAYVDAARRRLADWIDLAEERLSGSDVRCYMTGGNDDPEEILRPLVEHEGTHIVACEGRVVDVLGCSMASVGWSNPTPWSTPRETTEEQLADIIERTVEPIQETRTAIFNLHVPPKESGLDTCAKLDTTKWPPEPVVSGGDVVMFGAGSSAVSEAIRKRQPLLGLHGHIHESTGVARLGRTMCINPGSDYSSGALMGAIVAIADGEVKSHQMTRG